MPRYDILLELGRGGMAELLLARRSNIGGFEKLVAVKKILPHLAEDAGFRELFLNEARIAARLAHANVCTVYELDEKDGELFLAMEYLEGVGWDVLVKAAPRGELAMRLAAGVLVQACEGLHYAHTLRDPATGQVTPVVHRDVSPQNLFVTTDGVCKVLDFGIAKLVREGGGGSPKTRTGVLKGKLPYMAPEQIQGEPVDARTDVFALGVCFWEALTGERLFDRETDFLIWKAIIEEPVPSINAKVQRYPEAVDRVIGKALARKPGDRYATAQQLGVAIAAVAAPITDVEIGGLVRSLCADRLAKRAKEIARVVSESRAASLAMRAAEDGEDDPGATRGAKPSTIEREPLKLVEAPTSTVEPPSATVSMALRGDSLVMPQPPRARWPLVALALLAVGAIIVVVVIAMSGGSPKVVAEVPVDAHAIDVPPPHASVSFSANGITLGGSDGTTVEITKTAIKLPSRPPKHPVHPPLDAPVAAQPDAAPRAAVASPPDAAPVAGTLSIDSDPYAHVLVDGRAAGDTPLFGAAIPAGHHVVRLVLADGRTKDVSIDVPPGGAVNQGTIHW